MGRESVFASRCSMGSIILRECFCFRPCCFVRWCGLNGRHKIVLVRGRENVLSLSRCLGHPLTPTPLQPGLSQGGLYGLKEMPQHGVWRLPPLFTIHTHRHHKEKRNRPQTCFEYQTENYRENRKKAFHVWDIEGKNEGIGSQWADRLWCPCFGLPHYKKKSHVKTWQWKGSQSIVAIVAVLSLLPIGEVWLTDQQYTFLVLDLRLYFFWSEMKALNC